MDQEVAAGAASDQPLLACRGIDKYFGALAAVNALSFDVRPGEVLGIEEDAYESYLNRSREKIDVFDAAHSWTAQMVDEIILPGQTRKKIIEALELTRNKQEELPQRAKGHGTSPT